MQWFRAACVQQYLSATGTCPTSGRIGCVSVSDPCYLVSDQPTSKYWIICQRRGRSDAWISSCTWSGDLHSAATCSAKVNQLASASEACESLKLKLSLIVLVSPFPRRQELPPPDTALGCFGRGFLRLVRAS